MNQRIGFYAIMICSAVAAGALFLHAGCGRGLNRASIDEIERAEADWHKRAVRDYEIVVDVQGENDLRRTDLVIRDGRISHAVVRYWNPTIRAWERETALNTTQALPFTVPGLLETVKEEIENSGRTDIRISIKGDPPVPETIFLGNIVHGNRTISGSKRYIFVRKFSPLTN